MKNGNGVGKRGLPSSEEGSSGKAGPGFRELVKFSIKARRVGWYATRQGILKAGGDLKDVVRVLCWQLEIQGVAWRKAQVEKARLQEAGWQVSARGNVIELFGERFGGRAGK